MQSLPEDIINDSIISFIYIPDIGRLMQYVILELIYLLTLRTSTTMRSIFSNRFFWDYLYLRRFGTILPDFTIKENKKAKKKKEKKIENSDQNNCLPRRSYTIPTTVREKLQCDIRIIIEFNRKAIPIVQLYSKKEVLLQDHQKLQKGMIVLIL